MNTDLQLGRELHFLAENARVDHDLVGDLLMLNLHIRDVFAFLWHESTVFLGAAEV